MVALGVDAASSANASNSFKKRLSHQIAALHVLSMKATARALENEKRAGESQDDNGADP